MNDANLNPSLAGKRSGEKRREKSKQRMLLKNIIENAAYAKAPLSNEKLKHVAMILKKPVKDVTVLDVGIVQMAYSVMKGDMQCITFFRDMLGEKPADKVTGSVSLDMNFDFVVEPEVEDEGEAEDADGGVE